MNQIHEPSEFSKDFEETQMTCAELLLLPDGKILAHNLTPALARLLERLDPQDQAMQRRAHGPNHCEK